MASRRTVTTRDRKRNCAARKRTVKALLTRQQQQARLVARLISEARAAEKAA